MNAPIIVQLDPFTTQPQMLTVDQVAKVLCCTQTHVGHLIRHRKLAAFNFAGAESSRAVHRIHPAALQRFLQEAAK